MFSALTTGRRAPQRLEYVKEVMPAFVKDAVVKTKTARRRCVFIGMPTGEGESRLNGELLEGIIRSRGECLAAFPNGYSEHAAKGDVLELSEDTSDYGSISDTPGLYKPLGYRGRCALPCICQRKASPAARERAR